LRKALELLSAEELICDSQDSTLRTMLSDGSLLSGKPLSEGF